MTINTHYSIDLYYKIVYNYRYHIYISKECIQMRHVEVFFHLTLHRKLFPSTKNVNMRKYLEEYYKCPITDEEISRFLSTKTPSTREMTHFLRNKGFSVQAIADLLEMKQPSISYHLTRPDDRSYQNPLWVHTVEERSRSVSPENWDHVYKNKRSKDTPTKAYARDPKYRKH